MINFEISLWPNELELTLKILGEGTEFPPLSCGVNELFIYNEMISWHSMKKSNRRAAPSIRRWTQRNLNCTEGEEEKNLEGEFEEERRKKKEEEKDKN